MASQYEVGEKVTIAGKVIEAQQNEDGNFVHLKIKHSSGSTTLIMDEDQIIGVLPPDPEP